MAIEGSDISKICDAIEYPGVDVVTKHHDVNMQSDGVCVKKLMSELKDAKMKAERNNVKLQLLQMANKEAEIRFQVERNLLQRSVDVLRREIINKNKELEMKDIYRRRLKQAKVKLKEARYAIREKRRASKQIQKTAWAGQHNAETPGYRSGSLMSNICLTQSEHQPRGGLATLGMLASQVLSEEIDTKSSSLLPPAEIKSLQRQRSDSASTISADEGLESNRGSVNSKRANNFGNLPTRALQFTPNANRLQSPPAT